jgi:hypothetical protein
MEAKLVKGMNKHQFYEDLTFLKSLEELLSID